MKPSDKRQKYSVDNSQPLKVPHSTKAAVQTIDILDEANISKFNQQNREKEKARFLSPPKKKLDAIKEAPAFEK